MAKSALVVDDSDVMRRLVGFTLKQGGYAVTEAADGKQALACLDQGPFSVIITDLNMPVMDGVSFIAAARQHAMHRFVPILMLTTESQEAKRQQGKAAGATAWLVKPFDPDKLLGVVAKVVR
jgi:two-component system, chemotaxis family, chemotaxis protein CheY